MTNLVSSNDSGCECNSEYKDSFVESPLFSHYESSKQTLEIEDLIFPKNIFYICNTFIYNQQNIMILKPDHLV